METLKWPAEFPGLEQLDRLLRCGICYEYFSTALMTACSHNYCSLCIRKSIGYRTECPTCMKETFESQLRNNRILDDIVTLYLGFKSKLISALLCKQSNLPVNEVSTTSEHCAGDLQNTNRQVNCIKNEITTTSEEKQHCELFNREIISNPNVKEISDNDLRNVLTPRKAVVPSQLAAGGPSTSKSFVKIPSMFNSPKKNVQNSEAVVRKVTCPVCNVDIPEKNINFHLDNCLKREDDQVKIRNQQYETRNPLKKPVFHLLKQADLKKKLKEHGLNCSGSRETLVKRLERFILLYNTECDSLKPRPVADIIRQVEQEEQEEKKILIPQKILTFPKNDNEKSDDLRRKYLKKNKLSFDNLIQKAKLQHQQKQPQQPPLSCNTSTVMVIDVDDDNDNHLGNDDRLMSDQKNHLSDDSDCSSNSSITKQVDTINISNKKCPRKLHYSDDDGDVQVDRNLPSTHSLDRRNHVDESMCILDNNSDTVSRMSVSSVEKTPPKFWRISDQENSENDTSTPNVQVSPVIALCSSVKRIKSEKTEVQASPEMFTGEIQERCSLSNDNASDVESEKSVSLLDYDEDSTTTAGNRQNPYQFLHEIASSNSDIQDVPSVEVDLDMSAMQSTSEEYVPCVSHRRSKKRILYAAEQETFVRVLRKRSKQ